MLLTSEKYNPITNVIKDIIYYFKYIWNIILRYFWDMF